jgi:hypothetical protein
MGRRLFFLHHGIAVATGFHRLKQVIDEIVANFLQQTGD